MIILSPASLQKGSSKYLEIGHKKPEWLGTYNDQFPCPEFRTKRLRQGPQVGQTPAAWHVQPQRPGAAAVMVKSWGFDGDIYELI